MDKWQGKIAIVTGASAGIGAAIFRDLAHAGINVAGFARRKERLEVIIEKNKAAPGKMYAVECDITSEASVKRAFEWVQSHLGGVGILINNAGCGRFTKLLADEDNADQFKAVIDTNIFGCLLCTRHAYKSMQKHGDYGMIININSVAGHIVPFIKDSTGNIYSGTKHAITAATEVLRQELIYLKNDKIRVSVSVIFLYIPNRLFLLSLVQQSVSPGRVTTEFRQAGGIPIAPDSNDDGNLDAEDVSDAVMYLLGTKSHVNVSDDFC
jgi:NADP+-dependent farnesol dehydrogenase